MIRTKKRWLDKVKDGVKENGPLGEKVYDRATWMMVVYSKHT